ncbi:protein NRT1/ PTR FAMILY 2.7-like [Rutidosis leptorrhynchoides]|uniref:protein NRT1/ PTR FAMILY 2.7-like n=1 Tax=Rutidosis leptorrhynchoides TaxID=125765 RepID=UPI003A992CB7
MESSLASREEEAQVSTSSGRKKGGWITFPFIICAVAGIYGSGYGWLFNLMVYLIQEYNVKSISATQIFSVGMVLLTLSSIFHSLRPKPCIVRSNICESATKGQLTVLYIGITMGAIGLGCGRFNLATMGANQFEKPKEQAIVFNWYFFTGFVGIVLSSTVIFYVQSLSWGWGFDLCAGTSFLGWTVFVIGYFSYKHDKLRGSPFKDIARVVVAYIWKRKLPLSDRDEDYYHGSGKIQATASFVCLNRAALKTETDFRPDGSIKSSWKICTVQQVEDFKTLMRIAPIWSTSFFLSVTLAMHASFVVIQALVMDRHLFRNNFEIPAGSMTVIICVSSSISIFMTDRFIIPIWQKLTRQKSTFLQRIGVGHLFNILSMAVAAIVEARRLQVACDNHLQTVPGSVVPMTSTSTAMTPLVIAFAYYASSALTGLIRKDTSWLPDNINNGRLDNVYWTLVVIGILNLGYFLICSKLYKYQNPEKDSEK